jgi:hypothetical protein
VLSIASKFVAPFDLIVQKMVSKSRSISEIIRKGDLDLCRKLIKPKENEKQSTENQRRS